MATNSGSALAELLENIQQLTKNAKSLCKTKKYALSVHVSILSIEESAKYLILFCRSHLPEEIFRKRFQHLNKHAVSRAPWYLAGQLSVVYMVHVASEMQQGDDDLAKSIRTMSKYISHYFYRNDPEAVARSILGVLDLKDEDIIKENKKEIERQEKDRLSSVYVDISDNLEILSRPSEFDRKKAKKYTDMAEFCMRVSQFVGTPSETISDFVEMLPPVERQRMKREARKHALDLIRR